MPQAAQESFIDQVARGQVGRENHQHVKGDFKFASGMQGEVIDAVFQWDNPAVEQIARADHLAAKVIDEQDAAVGFHLEGCFVVFERIVKDQVQPSQGQFAARDNKGPADFDPARIAAGAAAQRAGAGGGGVLFAGEFVVYRVRIV